MGAEPYCYYDDVSVTSILAGFAERICSAKPIRLFHMEFPPTLGQWIFLQSLSV